MKHSKYGKLTEDSGFLVSDALNSNVDMICDIACCGCEDFSEHLVTCWNEHDTLGAKAELLDEAIQGTLMAKHFCEQLLAIGPNPPAANALLRLNSILAKAKELDK